MKQTTITMLAALAISSGSVFAADTYEIDSKKSKVTFKIMNKPPKATKASEVPGSFSDFSGTVVFDKADPSKSSVKMEVKTASVDTGNKKRDDHLRNQDFFKVKEYPKMTFKSTKVTKKGDREYEVEGKFTLLDKTKTIKVTFVPSNERDAGKVTFQIKRSEYGMTYRVPDTADEVDVTLDLVGKKK